MITRARPFGRHRFNCVTKLLRPYVTTRALAKEMLLIMVITAHREVDLIRGCNASMPMEACPTASTARRSARRVVEQTRINNRPTLPLRPFHPLFGRYALLATPANRNMASMFKSSINRPEPDYSPTMHSRCIPSALPLMCKPAISHS